MTQSSHVEQKVKAFIMSEFLPGEDPDELTATTPLISAGILDSIATLQLVTFLEQEFAISIEAHEADAEHLDSLQRICALVLKKAGAG
jgi:acyl carrier protein